MSRIIYITVRTPLGTGEEFIIPEMLELVSRKHDLLIVPRSPSGRRVSQTEASELQSCCVYWPLLSWTFFRAGLQGLAHNFKKCLNLLLRIFFHSGNIRHLMKNLAVFPKALWLAQLAKAWQADHLHAHWALTTATMAMIAGEIAAIPWSFTAHRGDIVENNMLTEKVKSAAFVRFISNKGSDLAQSIIGELPAKCRVVHMGVDLPKISFPKTINAANPFTIMCPANLLPVKGHAYLLQAIARLKKEGIFCKLLFAGEGPLKSSLHRLVDDFEINDRVTFLGQLSHSGLLQYYEKGLVDLVVLPSIDLGNGHHEGIPVSLMEAMAYGIPVIATSTGSIPELITKGAGILVPSREINHLADAVKRLIYDGNFRDKLALTGHQRVKDAFTVKDAIKRLCQLIEEERRN